MAFETSRQNSNEDNEKKKVHLSGLKIAIVNTTDALETQARDIAESCLTASKEDLRGFGGFFKKVWKHNLFHEYYRQKEIAASKAEILQSKNLYVHEEVGAVAHAEAMSAVVDRFVQEYDELIHTEAGEQRQKLDAESLTSHDLTTSVRSLVKDYAAGSIDKETFEVERARMVQEATGLSREEVLAEVRHTDNLFAVAEQARLAVEHGAGLEEIDKEIQIVLGTAKMGVRTEANFNTVDRLIKKVQGTKIGRFVNETTLATAVSVAYSVTFGLSQRLAQSKLLAWGSFGATAVLGGAIAGVRENIRVKEERRQHSRERAQGKEFTDTTERRSEMEQLIYKTVPARQLQKSLEMIAGSESYESFSASLVLLAQTEARIQLSDREQIDLIAYSSGTAVEQERLDLDLARAQAKVRLRQDLAQKKFELPNNQTFEELYKIHLDTERRGLVSGAEGIEARDSVFDKMKRRKVAAAATKAVLTGVVVGATVQEAVSLVRESQDGLIEGMIGPNDQRPTSLTALEGLRQMIFGEETYERALRSVTLPGDIRVTLPEGVELIPQQAGGTTSFTFTQDGEVVVENIEFEDGKLTPQSAEVLRAHDVLLQEEILQQEQAVMGPIASKEYVAERSDIFHRIHREFWYDNNTSAFDKNELKLKWGGEQGTGIRADGKYVFSVGDMTSGGSQRGMASLNPTEAMQGGKLKLLLSLSRDSQSMVVEVPVDSNGNVVIDPESDIAKIFFKNESGNLTFVGKYAEIAEQVNDGTSTNAYRILATHTGEGVAEVTGQSSVVKPITQTNFSIHEDAPYVEPPPFIPLFGRTPLEPMIRKTDQKNSPVVPSPYYFATSGFEQSAEQAERHLEERSERLKENPDATLDERLEIDEYLKRQEENHQNYIKEIAADLGPMNPLCEVSVCIPVADHQEGGNIYNTLLNYTNQTAHPDSFEIILFANHPDVDLSGNPVEPDETQQEILRFKNDFPQMNIRVASKVLSRENAKIGFIRKAMNDAVLLRQSQRPKSEPELIMVSNDADCKGVAPEYIENFITRFHNSPDLDSLVGQLDWDLEAYAKNPLIHIGTRLLLYIGAQSRQKGWHFNSSGANTAFRASIYAAVGGYDTLLKAGEDSDFGTRISSARVGAKKKKAAGYAGSRVSRLFTSARRAEMVLEKHGLSPREQWDKGFSAFDDEVRKISWQNKGLVNFDSPSEVSELIQGIEDVINRTILRGKQWGETSSHPMVKRALQWLGIVYKVKGDHSIEIVDASKLVAGLKKYQTEASEILQRKRRVKKSAEVPNQTPVTPAAANQNSPEAASSTKQPTKEGIEALESQIFDQIPKSMEAEEALAKVGMWDEASSYFVTVKTISSYTLFSKKLKDLVESNFRTLKKLQASAKKINNSDGPPPAPGGVRSLVREKESIQTANDYILTNLEIKEALPKSMRLESLRAAQGSWIEKDSYFTKIVQSPNYNGLDKSLKERIQSNLKRLRKLQNSAPKNTVSQGPNGIPPKQRT